MITDDNFQIANIINIFFFILLPQSINGGEKFECQHGPEECSGNRVQSCALHALEGQSEQQMEFVACFMHFGADLSGRQVS